MLGETPAVGSPKPTPAPAPAAKSNKSALLARIMAAQERAKQAQMKQEQPSEKLMMKALDGFTDDKPKPVMQMQQQPAAEIVQTTSVSAPVPAPAPSLEMFEMNMQQKPMAPPPAPVPEPVMAPMQVVAPAPPVVDNVSLDIFEAPASASTAPPAEAPGADLLGNFGGIVPPEPVVPKEVAPPAAQAETAALEEVYGCDLDGLALSPEEKQKMIEEQRIIMEQIAKESSNEKTSMAAIKADAFAARMTGNGPVMSSNVDGFTANEVEEQRKILEQIEKEKASTAVSNQGLSQMEQDRKLAESLQMSTQESRQMEEDRKLAERLQAEDYSNGDVSEYPGNRRAAVAGAAAATAAAASAGEKSWWDTMNDAMVAVGLTDPEAEEGTRSAEINAGGPPGSMSYSQRMMHNEGGEQEGLLGGGGGGGGGRVAQSKPLFSCVVDSISSTANMITGADQEEVHGVDTTSFLTTPGENNASGSYYAVPEHD